MQPEDSARLQETCNQRNPLLFQGDLEAELSPLKPSRRRGLSAAIVTSVGLAEQFCYHFFMQLVTCCAQPKRSTSCNLVGSPVTRRVSRVSLPEASLNISRSLGLL